MLCDMILVSGMKKHILVSLLFLICFAASAQDIDYAGLKKEFTADTAQVEQAYRNSTDYSTAGIINASISREEGYDRLLNKYYKILMNSLNEEGKKALRTTQRNWIKLRDSDRELVGAMHSQIYDEMGGGTIWGIVAADARADITRNRVLELYRYLQFGDIGGG